MNSGGLKIMIVGYRSVNCFPIISDKAELLIDDWKKLRAMSVSRLFPAHGNYDLPLENEPSGDSSLT